MLTLPAANSIKLCISQCITIHVKLHTHVSQRSLYHSVWLFHADCIVGLLFKANVSIVSNILAKGRKKDSLDNIFRTCGCTERHIAGRESPIDYTCVGHKQQSQYVVCTGDGWRHWTPTEPAHTKHPNCFTHKGQNIASNDLYNVHL